MSKNVAISPGFLAWSFNRSSTKFGDLDGLVTLDRLQLPKDLKSRTVGHLRRSFRVDHHEFLTGDQLAKGDTLISAGRSFAFLLLATGTASRNVSEQGIFASLGHGEASSFFFWKS
ncbi:hypothetical protein PoB_002728900 [Plakobranchus ocellatus]|uniref:Cyclic nucleotide-binding domain-containing protein n=1 Tax=Plakobranchus ocellatus TaxID=259542 RepID=A0AAV3ZZL2_9GAST|nr:hypothetical protein PoB_002728900 [Plakobranchus ocellatus]